MTPLRALLHFPTFYSWTGKILGGGTRSRYVREFVRPVAGQRILDIGCGPGDFFAYLPEVDYLGIDISPEYIQKARERFGDKARFRQEDVMQTELDEPHSYDLVTANGLLHHLTDEQATRFFAVARQALRPAGRVVTLDGCWWPGQSPVAKLLLSMDRGKYIRRPEAYRALAEKHFPVVKTQVAQDMLRVPYTLSIMECTLD